MSAGTGKPQKGPRWEEKFSQMFVIMLSAKKPNTRLGMSLAKERDFVSSAEGPDPEKDASFPDCCLCGLKRSSALAVPPVFEVGAAQLGSSCPHSQQGVMEATLETTTLRLDVPSSDTAPNTGGREAGQPPRLPAISPVPGGCGSAACSTGWECFS